MLRRLFWFLVGAATGAFLTVRGLGRTRLGRLFGDPGGRPADARSLSADVLELLGRRLGDYGRS